MGFSPLSRTNHLRDIESCSFRGRLKPNALKTVSEIELSVDAVGKWLHSMDKPWNNLPGHELNSRLSVGARKTLDGSLEDILAIEFNSSVSQGYLTNAQSIRLAGSKNDGDTFNYSIDVNENYPNISDATLPLEVTESQISISTRLAHGNTRSNESGYIVNNVTIKLSDVHKDQLRRRAASSECAKDKMDESLARPAGSVPLTWHCIKEMIVNTTLRKYTISYNSNQPSRFSSPSGLGSGAGADPNFLLRLGLISVMMQQLRDQFPRADVRLVKNLFPVDGDGEIAFDIDYPANDVDDSDFWSNNFVRNVYFDKDFVMRFMQNNVEVTNVYPNLIVTKKNRGVGADLTDWKAFTEDEGNRVSVKSVDGDRLAVKWIFEGHELSIEPAKADKGMPTIRYDGEDIGEFEERTVLPVSEAYGDWVFSLLKVGGYVKIEPYDYQVSIYYSINSVTIIKKRR